MFSMHKMSADDWEENRMGRIQEILTRYRVPENRKAEAAQLVIFISNDVNFSRGDLQSIMKQARIWSLRDLYRGINDELLQEELSIEKYNYVTLLRNQYYARKRFMQAGSTANSNPYAIVSS